MAEVVVVVMAEVTEEAATEEAVVVVEATVEIAMRSRNIFRALPVHQALQVTREIRELLVIRVPLGPLVILAKMELPDCRASEGLQENQATMEFLGNREYPEKEVIWLTSRRRFFNNNRIAIANKHLSSCSGFRIHSIGCETF